MLTLFALGVAIGFVAGVSPGPVLTLVVTETLRGGWVRGAAVAAGPLLADGPIILLALGLLGQLPGGLIPSISLVGGLFLLYLAAMNAWRARRASTLQLTAGSARRGLMTGLAARGLSPHPYLFWFLIGGPILITAAQDGWHTVLAFLVGYYLAVVGSNVGLAAVIHRWLGSASQRVYRGVLVLSSAILAGYGLVLIGRSRS